MKALIVIDMQNDFITGSLGSEEAQKIVPKVQRLINEYFERGDAIYYTQDTHYLGDYHMIQEGRKLPTEHCIFGSDGWRIADGLDIQQTSFTHPIYHLNKNTFAYDNWEDEYLNQYEEITICGLVSSICVVSNALVIKALYPELEIKFAAYASAGLTEDNHKAAIEVMRSCQIGVIE